MLNEPDLRPHRLTVKDRLRALWRYAVHVLGVVGSWSRQGRFRVELAGYLSHRPAFQAAVYWVSATLVGLVAVAYAQCFGLAADLCAYWIRSSPWVVVAMGPLCFSVSRWLVVRYAPGAAGSGIPHVMAAASVDPPYCDQWVGIRVSIVKVLSSLLALLGGGVLGREGPTIQIAAGIFYSIGKRCRSIWPTLNHQSLLIAGGAAGLAAAFNTPLGGIVYAIEELSHRNFHRFKTVLISAVIIAGLVAQGLQGPYLYFGFPKIPVVSSSLLPWAFGIGIFVGLCGAIFGKLLLVIGKQVRRWDDTRRMRFAFLMGAVIPILALSAGPQVIGGGSDLIRQLLFNDDKNISWGIVAGRYFGPLVTYATGVAGGVFAPSLAAGAALGAKLSLLTSSENANFVVLLSMIAFLSGVSRAPFTSFVLVMEMTDRHSAIFAMMVASLVATLAGKLVDRKSFYDRAALRLVRSLPKEAQKRRAAKQVPNGL